MLVMLARRTVKFARVGTSPLLQRSFSSKVSVPHDCLKFLCYGRKMDSNEDERGNYFVCVKFLKESTFNKDYRAHDLYVLSDTLREYQPFRPTNTEDFKPKKKYGLVQNEEMLLLNILKMGVERKDLDYGRVTVPPRKSIGETSVPMKKMRTMQEAHNVKEAMKKSSQKSKNTHGKKNDAHIMKPSKHHSSSSKDRKQKHSSKEEAGSNSEKDTDDSTIGVGPSNKVAYSDKSTSKNTHSKKNDAHKHHKSSSKDRKKKHSSKEEAGSNSEKDTDDSTGVGPSNKVADSGISTSMNTQSKKNDDHMEPSKHNSSNSSKDRKQKHSSKEEAGSNSEKDTDDSTIGVGPSNKVADSGISTSMNTQSKKNDDHMEPSKHNSSNSSKDRKQKHSSKEEAGSNSGKDTDDSTIGVGPSNKVADSDKSTGCSAWQKDKHEMNENESVKADGVTSSVSPTFKVGVVGEVSDVQDVGDVFKEDMNVVNCSNCLTLQAKIELLEKRLRSDDISNKDVLAALEEKMRKVPELVRIYAPEQQFLKNEKFIVSPEKEFKRVKVSDDEVYCGDNKVVRKRDIYEAAEATTFGRRVARLCDLLWEDKVHCHFLSGKSARAPPDMKLYKIPPLQLKAIKRILKLMVWEGVPGKDQVNAQGISNCVKHYTSDALTKFLGVKKTKKAQTSSTNSKKRKSKSRKRSDSTSSESSSHQSGHKKMTKKRGRSSSSSDSTSSESSNQERNKKRGRSERFQEEKPGEKDSINSCSPSSSEDVLDLGNN